MKYRGALLTLAASVTAFLFAIFASALVLLLTTSESPLTVFQAMWEFGTTRDSLASTLNRATPMYVAGIAAAIGFKMNLLNIGVEGQYRIAVLLAASVGAAVSLPKILHIGLILIVAMIAGMLWALIPAILKVTRNVHEVISTIMMNAIAIGLGAWLFTTYLKDEKASTINPRTPRLDESAFLGAIWRPEGADAVTGFLVFAVLLGIGYYVLVWKTRFGFDLRASGLNPIAARTAGVDAKRMVFTAMLMSGAVAGLVAMPALLSDFHAYSNDQIPSGLGFAGIGVALLGRNHPFGVAIGALVFAFIDRSALILDLEGIPKEIVRIMQAIIVLSVVIAYEVARRIGERRTASALAARTPATGSTA